jgi:hypothetical protein
MSSDACALLSSTFVEVDYDHLIELVHQRDGAARRHLSALDVAVFRPDGTEIAAVEADPREEVLDLRALVEGSAAGPERVMVLLDARYEERRFPYRPHHYGFLHREGSDTPPLYYAVNAVLGGVPDRIGATAINNF